MIAAAAGQFVIMCAAIFAVEFLVDYREAHGDNISLNAQGAMI